MPARRPGAWCLTILAMLTAAPTAWPQTLVQDKTVRAATRLDGSFAAHGFGKDAGKLPANYDSTKQRYQLFVPKQLDKSKAAPLVLFISSGDQPSGWAVWQKVCAENGVLFASP